MVLLRTRATTSVLTAVDTLLPLELSGRRWSDYLDFWDL